MIKFRPDLILRITMHQISYNTKVFNLSLVSPNKRKKLLDMFGSMKLRDLMNPKTKKMSFEFKEE